MNQEIMTFKGQLADLKVKYKGLDIEASGLVILVRTLVNPYAEPITLKTEQASQSAKRLHKVVSEMKTISEKIKEIEETLNV